jgi:hypothetical protein
LYADFAFGQKAEGKIVKCLVDNGIQKTADPQKDQPL